MMQDTRLALRSLRSTPLVTAVAILSLALGIGANTAIFSIFDSLLLRKLPVDDPDRLALVLSRDDPRFFGWSYMLWDQIRQRREQVFETAVAFSPTRFNLVGARRDQLRGRPLGQRQLLQRARGLAAARADADRRRR